MPENVEKLHAMRIAGKQLRYTLEIFAPIYDTALLPYIQIMKDLQDQLGSIHDDDVWVVGCPNSSKKKKNASKIILAILVPWIDCYLESII